MSFLLLQAGGVDLSFEVASNGVDGAPLACSVWDAGLALFFFLASEPPGFTRSQMRHCSAVELGAGTGVAGVALALLGCRTLVTDLPAALPLLERNVACAAAAGGSLPMRTAPLEWGAAEMMQALAGLPADWPTPSLLLAADCVYDGAALPQLRAALRAFARPGCRALLALDTARAPSVCSAFQNALIHDGWTVQRVPADQLDAVVQDDALHVLLLTWGEAEPAAGPHVFSAGATGVTRAEWRARRAGRVAARLLTGW